MSSILEADSIIKYFGQNMVLSDIYVRCQTGDIIGLLGRNGSGKSTLMKILFGTLPADNKFIRINGQIVSSPYKSKEIISFLPQHTFIPKYLTVEDAVKLYTDRPTEDGFFIDENLPPARKLKISSLSGGERRYLEIRLILSLRTQFVLLDEPFTGASPILAEKIRKLITDASANKGIILTDHDYRNVISVANRYCIMFDGGIREVRSIEEMVSRGYLPGRREK